MKTEEVIRIIAGLKSHRCELAAEAKTAHDETPKRIYQVLSAFSNHPNGGILLLGIDEKQGFKVVGVNNPQRQISEISDVASAQMEPPICPEFGVHQIEGENVVVVEIFEIPNIQKPCYYKDAGLHKGSYYRVGNSSRKMSEYMIYGYMSMREQPEFDIEVTQKASLEDLDEEKITAFLQDLKDNRPQASYLDEPHQEVLSRLRIIQKDNGTFRPTLTGLLIFGKYPQEFEPQMLITFLQYYGIKEDEQGPRGERFIDNQKFEGPIPIMIENAIKQVHASIRKSSIIDGLFRREIPEYPYKALREAIINTVTHRDYSKYAKGSYIQCHWALQNRPVFSYGQCNLLLSIRQLFA